MKNNRNPKWVLFEQLHINVDIRTDMPVKDRAMLRKRLNSPAYKMNIIGHTLIGGPTPKTATPQIKVRITK